MARPTNHTNHFNHSIALLETLAYDTNGSMIGTLTERGSDETEPDTPPPKLEKTNELNFRFQSSKIT